VKVLGAPASAGLEAFVGWYALISRGFGAEDLEIGAGTRRGGGSTVDRMEFRWLELKKLGGDFIENPDRVLPCVLLLLPKV
jgi:hypothetical protein